MLNSWKTEATSPSASDPVENGAASKPAFASAQPAPAASTSITGKGQKSQSIVDECLTMKGDLESEANILVKGKVLGNINCHVLIIDTDALVEGGIEAKEVIVRGKVKGVINADRVQLEGTADAECDIYQKVFAAEEGARIRGALKNKEDFPSGGVKAASVNGSGKSDGAKSEASPAAAS